MCGADSITTSRRISLAQTPHIVLSNPVSAKACSCSYSRIIEIVRKYCVTDNLSARIQQNFNIPHSFPTLIATDHRNKNKVDPNNRHHE
jgi:hypothetical protein